MRQPEDSLNVLLQFYCYCCCCGSILLFCRFTRLDTQPNICVSEEKRALITEMRVNDDTKSEGFCGFLSSKFSLFPWPPRPYRKKKPKKKVVTANLTEFLFTFFFFFFQVVRCERKGKKMRKQIDDINFAVTFFFLWYFHCLLLLLRLYRALSVNANCGTGL